VANSADVLRRAGDLLKWIEDGKLKITIGKVFWLADAAQAHRTLESRQSVGKIVLIP
jgi:NADPH2:quinone reductase